MMKTITLLCDDCGLEFLKRLHQDGDPLPDCPACAIAVRQIPGMFSITTNKAKAIDYTQKMAEEDFGLTNFRDNTEIGENAILPEPIMQTAEREAIARQMVEAGAATPLTQEIADTAKNFWSGPIGGTPGLMDQARAAPKGADSVGLLEKGRETGSMPFKLNVVARADAGGRE